PKINLTQYVQNEDNSYTIPWSRFSANAWSLEPPAVDELMQKIQRVGVPLKEFASVKPICGIKTGLNEAFFIDDATKKKLVLDDPKCAEIIKPILRGQDIKRWCPEWDNLWIIFAHKDIDIEQYPIIKQHLENYRNKLENRAGKQLWWQLQASPASYHLFAKPKIIWQDLAFHSRFCLEQENVIIDMTCFVLPCSDLWLLAVLNSPLMWYWLWRNTIHGKDEVLRLKNIYTETLPIAQPTAEIRAEVEEIVTRLIEITKLNGQVYKDVLDWLQIEYKIEKLGNKLADFATLEFDEFVEEVRKRMPKPKTAKKASDPLSIPAFKALRQAHNDYVPEIQNRKNEAVKLEQRLADLVNQTYQLTPEEIDLMWKTAPPRMPI
ncbi:class I SAM-dependent DNA methyltransferase, partial [Anabaena aphanizomenioides LEGE 00250]